MGRNAWSDDDRNEYDALISECLAVPVVADRRELFLDGLDDAVQAHRHWALDVRGTIRNEGADKILKYEQDLRRPRVPISQDGQVLGKAPREFGRKVRSDDGTVVYERMLFDYLTFDELRDKRREFARSERAARVDRQAVDKLLTLEERVPGAATPAEACALLGTTVEAFLADESAA